MGQAVELIEMNLKKIKDVKGQCQAFEKDIKDFQRELKFKGFELEIEPLDYPMTVCAASACKRYEPVGKSGQQNIVYEQVCHDHCNLKLDRKSTRLNSSHVRTSRMPSSA